MTNLYMIMSTNIKERKLGPSFGKEKIKQVKQLINSSTSFTIVGMPGMGISIFLRYLTTKHFAHFIHVDLYELTQLTTTELFRLLLNELRGKEYPKTDTQELLKLCQTQLVSLAKRYKKVVIVFNRFDQLKERFDKSFFNNLRTLRDVNKEKIVMVFSTNKPLYEQVSKVIDRGNLNMYSKTFYLKPYSENDLRLLLKVNAPYLNPRKDVFEKALKLCGGHYQLLLLLLKSERLKNFLMDQFVKLQLKQLYENLNYLQRKQVSKISLGRKPNSIDEFLLNLGIVEMKEDNYHLFTPLFSEFIKSILPMKLSKKEQKLFSLLKRNLGKVVTKEKIFDSLWENTEKSSDWALNALIYRLRRNLELVNNGYYIESHKKIGYLLIKV